MKTHSTHHTRVSDASTYDEICSSCGATDTRGSGLLGEPCPAAAPPLAPGLVLAERVMVYGKDALRIVARVKGHKRKDGQTYKEKDETYLLEILDSRTDLWRLTKMDGTVRLVTPDNCTCPAFEFGRGALCKHVLALERLGEFPAPDAGPVAAGGA